MGRLVSLPSLKIRADIPSGEAKSPQLSPVASMSQVLYELDCQMPDIASIFVWHPISVYARPMQLRRLDLRTREFPVEFCRGFSQRLSSHALELSLKIDFSST